MVIQCCGEPLVVFYIWRRNQALMEEAGFGPAQFLFSEKKKTNHPKIMNFYPGFYVSPRSE
jgi:hypothetical protein